MAISPSFPLMATAPTLPRPHNVPANAEIHKAQHGKSSPAEAHTSPIAGGSWRAGEETGSWLQAISYQWMVPLGVKVRWWVFPPESCVLRAERGITKETLGTGSRQVKHHTTGSSYPGYPKASCKTNHPPHPIPTSLSPWINNWTHVAPIGSWECSRWHT